MQYLPKELAEARITRTEAWNEYHQVIDREHTSAEFHAALTKAGQADKAAADLYARWQAVGGTSDIESIEAAERFLNLVEVALTHAETIAIANSGNNENLGTCFTISGGEVMELDAHLESQYELNTEEDMPF